MLVNGYFGKTIIQDLKNVNNMSIILKKEKTWTIKPPNSKDFNDVYNFLSHYGALMQKDSKGSITYNISHTFLYGAIRLKMKFLTKNNFEHEFNDVTILHLGKISYCNEYYTFKEFKNKFIKDISSDSILNGITCLLWKEEIHAALGKNSLTNQK